ncbi:hypothetical protein Q0M68_13875, partial [Staphylococcus aureus]|nr:hypothetical protein [Staphylococcus aureus]
QDGQDGVTGKCGVHNSGKWREEYLVSVPADSTMKDNAPKNNDSLRRRGCDGEDAGYLTGHEIDAR